ncbi:dipeptide/oligopeptide/nickel ABC transporter permease/ATP-binding protein [Amycolatopsis sp. 3B14]|uniref:dipeptide/oligopeptide/nickel ABC transporter permease/ATP-binding protein n=1 Tax=Amycolatopsis sp. 3B14 TaxID=3243600 RepID=UPI003D9515C4
MTTMPTTSARGRGGDSAGVWRAVIRRPLGALSLAYLAVVATAAIAAPWLAPYDPTATDLSHVLSMPSADHWLGTDRLGRDILSRLMYGGQVTLLGVLQAVATVLVLGVAMGLASGFLGGRVDRALNWLIDVVLAIPVIITLLVVLAVFGTNETAAMVTLGVLGAPGLARVVRGVTLAVRQEPYIAAARVAGLPSSYIVLRHVLPRCYGPIIVQASLFAGVSLLTETGLGYLGLGVQPPTPTWGGMVADASQVIDQQPWMLVPAGAVIGLGILAFGLLGDVVRDATGQRGKRAASTRAARRGTLRAEPAAHPASAEPAALLSVRGLSVALPTAQGTTTVVEDVDLDINPGQTVGIVGESGCGKSITGRAILGLLPAGGTIASGSIRLGGDELTTMTKAELARLRGRKIALISQEPLAGLDPVFTVGQQIDELVRRHDRLPRRHVRARTLELLTAVRLPDPEGVAARYPYQLSGGMAQRVVIALALAGRPELLIADEPTTALDVTVQAEILDLLRQLQGETGMAILLITHDWGVVADLCDRAYVMYAGHMVESAPTEEMFDVPLHPYTAGLLRSSPRLAEPGLPLPAIEGTVPEPRDWPAGCHFAPRCPLATAVCREGAIAVAEPEENRRTKCIRFDEVRRGEGHDGAGTLARR